MKFRLFPHFVKKHGIKPSEKTARSQEEQAIKLGREQFKALLKKGLSVPVVML